jgi:hypothetical protein
MAESAMGPDIHIMTTAATGLSERFANIKQSVCTLVIRYHTLTAARTEEKDLYAALFSGGDKDIEEDLEDVGRYTRSCESEIRNAINVCDDLIKETYFELRTTLSIADALCIKIIRYEIMTFTIGRDEMPPLRKSM